MVPTNDYIQKVLIANGIRDIVVGLMLFMASNQRVDWQNFFLQLSEQ